VEAVSLVGHCDYLQEQNGRKALSPGPLIFMTMNFKKRLGHDGYCSEVWYDVL
jgi:hypothetical protein